MANKLSICVLFSFLFLVSACATTNINPSRTFNPPPAKAFSDYKQLELKGVELASDYAEHSANKKARNKIQEIVTQKLDASLSHWNRQNQRAGKRGTLLIEPEITKIKFIGGAGRFWVGPMAGSSAVIMKANFREKESGRIIASPEFYQHANAWGGAYSMGATDNAMLNRVASLFVEYVLANYSQPVGGSSGAPTDKVQ